MTLVDVAKRVFEEHVGIWVTYMTKSRWRCQLGPAMQLEIGSKTEQKPELAGPV